MFQMAHSTSLNFKDEHHRPQSALSAALEAHSKGYSTYQTLKKRDATSNIVTPAAGGGGGWGERHLAQEENVDSRYSKYKSNSEKPRIKTFGVGHDLVSDADEEEAVLLMPDESQANRNAAAVVVNKPPKNDNRPPDGNNNHNHAQKNIFSQRAQPDNTGKNEALVVSPTDQEERALKVQQEQHEAARREALRVHRGDTPNLDDPRRGGSATATTTTGIQQDGVVVKKYAADDPEIAAEEVRAIKAAFALEAAKKEEQIKVEVHATKDKGGNSKGKNTMYPKLERLNKEEQSRLRNLYEEAVIALRDPSVRESIDPLFITSPDTPLDQIQRIPFAPKVRYLGVMVDAGRHYFPISWWKHLIVYLYKLRYNVIHFRLTDDQTFNLQLKSYPELANPVQLKYNVDKKTYTPGEVKELVQFAKGYNISIVPEINIPGHAGGFAGIKDLVIMCAEFICHTGYGLPLNVDHPELKTILSNILKEILDIFDNPPFLHLGGDEVNMADPCFFEIGKRPFNYTNFETDLKDVLAGLNYPLDQVIRWERTGQSLSLQRAGNIEHFWESLPGMQAPMGKLPNGKLAPWFASRGLYFDTNHDDDGINVYRNTQRLFQLNGIPDPLAIIAGTFELGTEFWRQRNVAARLIAVAIGASRERLSEPNFYETLHQTCLDLDIDVSWCDLQGNTATLKKHFSSDHLATWGQWKRNLCERLTEEEMKLAMKSIVTTKKTLEANGYEVFWENFAEETDQKLLPRTADSSEKAKSLPLKKHAIPFTGMIFDMVNSIKSPSARVLDLSKTFIAPLGFKLLQLRLIDDFGFGIQFNTQSKLGYFANRHIDETTSDKKDNILKIPNAQDYRELVALIVNQTRLQVIPELEISTNAGGWVHSGFAAACPHVLCDSGKGVANSITDPGFLPVVYSVLRELKDIFPNSPFLHLGHDERDTASKGCLKEALLEDPMTELSQFEEKLALITDMLGIEQGNILRWSNQEKKQYSDRTGNITHYQAQPLAQLPKPNSGERFFATLDLLTGSPWDIYKKTIALVNLKPEGILGEIRDLDETTWDTKNVGLRMVAFAMGLQQDPDPDINRDAFLLALNEACHSSEIAGCDGADGSGVTIPVEVEQGRYQDKMCAEFTYNTLGRSPRKHIS